MVFSLAKFPCADSNQVLYLFINWSSESRSGLAGVNKPEPAGVKPEPEGVKPEPEGVDVFFFSGDGSPSVVHSSVGRGALQECRCA